MKFTLNYLMIKRLGEMAGLEYSDISPMNELAPDTEVLINALPADAISETDKILKESGLTNDESGEMKPAKRINAFIKALFAPETCLRAELKEENGSSDVYFIPFDGAWLMMNAKHGELTVAGPVSYEVAKQYLVATMNSALESGVLSAQYRDEKCKRSVTVTNAEEGYAFFGSLFDKTEAQERVYIHSFAKTEENKKHIAKMLTGEIGFELPEDEKEQEQPDKPSAKRVLRGIGIALLVNICAAVIVAVLKAVL